MKKKKRLIVVGGATASGKTAAAIHIARHYKTAILSADSRQFFREMSIGTAKPTAEELAAAPHFFINNLSIHDDYSVGDFERAASVVLKDIFAKNDVAVLVGGTGLYIKAVCNGLDNFPEVPLSIRQYFEDIFIKEGIEPLQKRLQIVDPQYFVEVDVQNPKRLIRALSVFEASGKPFSSFTTGEKIDRDFDIIYIALDVPRVVLYDKINRRVDAMMSAGLLEEAKSLLPFRHLNALQTVGYVELFAYFDGQMSLDEAVEKIEQHSRNYAKRQLTWLRKEAHWRWFSPKMIEQMGDFVDL